MDYKENIFVYSYKALQTGTLLNGLFIVLGVTSEYSGGKVTILVNLPSYKSQHFLKIDMPYTQNSWGKKIYIIGEIF